MAGRVAEVFAVPALAVIVTAVMAAPVLRAPSERVFGREIVGRHHDPFTVMQQFDGPVSLGVYSQPVTDVTGAMIARIAGPVAAYNWLVLLTFPLAAAAAYLLARHLALSPPGAAVAAMAFAFSPFHVAQAAYHPHIAQVQWIPVYLLALWRCLDGASVPRLACLGAAAAAVTLSNFYGGLIAAVMTPVAVLAYWVTMRHAHPRSTRSLGLTVGSLVLLAASGVGYAWYAAGPVVANRTAFAFPRQDLFRYSATWSSYLAPPVAHPWLGWESYRAWTAAGVREGLLEQQVSLGWALLALAAIAVGWWLARDRQTPSLSRVPVLVVVAVAAFLCSLSPQATIGTFTFERPASLLYDVAPMFRSYGRFGVVVQLMVALLAGIGFDRLRRAGTTGAQAVCGALVAIAGVEYAVSPSAMWRDVLPTRAHRWVMQQKAPLRVLDCAWVTPATQSVPWLTNGRVTFPDDPNTDCAEPGLPRKLAETGYTHLLVPRGTPEGHLFTDRPPAGVRIAARFRDGHVFELTPPQNAIHTGTMRGFYPRERDAEGWWQWMGADGSWTVINTTSRPVLATLHVELRAIHHSRRMNLRLDGRQIESVVVDQWRRAYRLGPLPITPGPHEVSFHAVERPTTPDDVTSNGDRRALTFEFRRWSWTVTSERP